MDGFELRSLGQERVSRIVACQQDAFADYPLPAGLDEVGLKVYLRETGVELGASYGAYCGDRLASFCLAALRGSTGSIRGEGTVQAHRRCGMGGAVLDRALEALSAGGAGEVGLEVLEQNAGAIALYQAHGFEVSRRLLGWTLGRRMLRRPAAAVPIAPAEGVRRLRAWGWEGAPWQLQTETLVQLPAYALGDDTVAFVKVRGRRLWLYALAVDPASRGLGRGTALMRALPGHRISIPALIPEGWPAATGFLTALGGRQDEHAQLEMTRRMPVPLP